MFAGQTLADLPWAALATQIDRQTLIAEYDRVRERSEALCAPLAVDDYQIQSVVQTSASPTDWSPTASTPISSLTVAVYLRAAT